MSQTSKNQKQKSTLNVTVKKLKGRKETQKQRMHKVAGLMESFFDRQANYVHISINICELLKILPMGHSLQKQIFTLWNISIFQR